MGKTPLRIIQISDTHVLADASGELLGVKTRASFEAVVNLVKEQKGNIDLILLSGDLSQDGSITAYHLVADALSDLQVPIYFVPGNHDDPEVLAAAYPHANVQKDKHILLNNWQLLLLNSQKPGAVEGYLAADQLAWMQQNLQSHPTHHSLVLFHHHPVKVGAAWLDNLGLTNADEFWKTILPFPNAKVVLFGHVHQEFSQQVDRIACYSAPSTCIQFKRKQDHFGLEKLPPGYRWIHLFEDGHIETGVKRVAEYVGHFDENAKGY